VSRKLDARALPRPFAVLLGVVALLFAGLWAQHHGYLDTRALRHGLRGERFQLRHVDFVGLSALDPGTLWQFSGVPNGTPLVDIDPEAVVQALSANPRIARVRVARLAPDRLVVGVVERVPVALEMSSGMGLADDGTRFPLEAGEAERLPQVSGDPRRALPVLAAARELGLNVATVDAPRTKNVRMRALGRPTVLVVGRDAQASLTDWRQLADSGLVESTGAREVDLRFRGNPVLRDFPKTQGTQK
jgi:cell division septal protein FtsQ